RSNRDWSSDVCSSDLKLRHCFLAPHHFEAPFQSELLASDPACGFALSCRISRTAVQRLAFRSNRRAPMARRPASLAEWSDALLRSDDRGVGKGAGVGG